MAHEAKIAFSFDIEGPVQTQRTGALDRPYWVYHIHWRTNSPVYPCKEQQCQRRYSDFEWLRKRLISENPWCIVPPIPEKDIAGTIEKFVGSHQELLSYRKRGLQKFLVRLTSHTHLRGSLLLKDFLELDAPSWQHRMQDPHRISGQAGPTPGTAAPPSGTAGAAPKESTLASWMHSVTHAVSTQMHPTPMGDTSEAYQRVVESEPLPHTTQVWEAARHHVQTLQASLEVLRDRVEEVVTSHHRVAHQMDKTAHTIAEVTGIEESESPGLAATGGPSSGFFGGSLSDHHASPPRTLTQTSQIVSGHLKGTADIMTAHSDKERQFFAELLRFYCGMCRAVVETVRGLEAAIRAKDHAVQKEEEFKLYRDQQVASQSAMHVSKANIALQDATLSRECAERYVDELQAQVRQEFRRFDAEKRCDLREIARFALRLQQEYTQSIQQRWHDHHQAVTS